MSYIKTWNERCDEHPDHQSGMVSNGMIQARMQEEIDDLRAENERLRAANKQLVEGIDTITRRKQEEIERQRAENDRLREVLRDIARTDYTDDPFCELTPEGLVRWRARHER